MIKRTLLSCLVAVTLAATLAFVPAAQPVAAVDACPGIDITKDVSPGEAPAGYEVVYTITIRNTGSVNLTNVTVMDTLLGDLSASFTDNLTPGQSETKTFPYTIPLGTTGTLTNIATVSATAVPCGTCVCDGDCACVCIIPGEGCTPGFWKNHTNIWPPTGYSPGQTLESVFNVPDSLGIDNDTLMDALEYGGGPGTLGMAKNLLRQAVAALLNSAHPDINYSMSTSQVISQVNAALASGSRSTMETLKNKLDMFNSLGCPIDAHGNVID